jgi:hypothetical protein
MRIADVTRCIRNHLYSYDMYHDLPEAFNAFDLAATLWRRVGAAKISLKMVFSKDASLHLRICLEPYVFDTLLGM